jgi:hypothetical protein
VAGMTREAGTAVLGAAPGGARGSERGEVGTRGC